MLPDNYQAPTLTVECVIFQLIDGKLTTLIGRVRSELYKGWWALPGGFCSKGETTRMAVGRNILEKSGIEVSSFGLLEQLHTFDIVAEDERGHVVDVVYYGLCRETALTVWTPETTPHFTPVYELPELAYGHREFVDYALRELRTKIHESNAMVALMPDTFTLLALQRAYEAVLGHNLDKGNFRKWALSRDMLTETGDMSKESAHRPARFYTFKNKDIHALSSL